MPPNPQDPSAARRFDSFRHAFAGWAYVLRTQQCLDSRHRHAARDRDGLVATLSRQMGPSLWPSGLWISEFVNTALETVVDLASPDLHPLAKAGKDVRRRPCCGRAHRRDRRPLHPSPLWDRLTVQGAASGT
jgi:hypothetical protein